MCVYVYFFFFQVEKQSFIRRESILPDAEAGLHERSVAQRPKDKILKELGDAGEKKCKYIKVTTKVQYLKPHLDN